MEEKEDEEYEYNNNNIEDIYDEGIDYYKEIGKGDMDGLLEDTERNPN